MVAGSALPNAAATFSGRTRSVPFGLIVSGVAGVVTSTSSTPTVR